MHDNERRVPRQTQRLPAVRRPNKFDELLLNIILFMKKLGIELSKTLAATALAAAADYIRKKADADTASMLNRHGGLGVPSRPTENQRNLYGNYPSAPANPYGYQSSNGYDNRRASGQETFPGFGN